MSELLTLNLTSKLLAVLAIIQGLEFLRLSKTTSEQGIWRWSQIKLDLFQARSFLDLVLTPFLEASSFNKLNLFRVLLGVGLIFLFQPAFLFALLLIHLLTLIRWRGPFNGGSDFMNSLLLGGTTLAMFFSHSEKIVAICLWYMGVQTLLSYFRAGLVKIKNPRWREGIILKRFLFSSTYETSPWLAKKFQSTFALRSIAWAIILFEISFPLAFLHPTLALFYMIAGGFFHLINGYLFGLNRFFFAWLAAYPIVFYCASFTRGVL